MMAVFLDVGVIPVEPPLGFGYSIQMEAFQCWNMYIYTHTAVYTSNYIYIYQIMYIYIYIK